MGERAISFDLDGTLVDFRFCDRVWLEEIPRLAASRWGCPQQEARRRVREAYREVGELRLEWYDMRYWFRRFGLPGDPGELLERCREAVRPYPEVPEVLRRLRAAGWQPVVISNAARPFMELELRQAGLWDLLEGAVSTTSDLGLVKADPRAYLEGCRLLGIEPFSCPMNIAALERLGLAPFHVKGRPRPLEGWSNKRFAPTLTTPGAWSRKLLFAVPEGANRDAPSAAMEPSFRAKVARLLLLRPLWAGSVRPSRIVVKNFERKLLEKELAKRSSRARLSTTDEAFFELVSELPRRDVGQLLTFLKSESETIEAGTGDPRRLGNALRLGDALLEFHSFTARPVIAATEIVRGVVFGRWGYQDVMEDLRVWEEIHSLSAGTKLSINRLNPPRRRILGAQGKS